MKDKSKKKIPEKRRKENKPLESCEDCFFRLGEYLDAGIAVIGENDRIFETNDAFSKELGTKKEFLRGEMPLAFLNDIQKPSKKNIPCKVYKLKSEPTKILEVLEILHNHKNCPLKKVLLLIDSQFETIKYRALEKANLELSKKTKELELAKAIIESTLAKTSTEVEAIKGLDRVKSTFISIASHELKTPLTVILGYLDVFQKRHKLNLSDDAKKILDGLQRNSLALMNVVEDLLEFSRLEAGKVKLEKVRISLMELLKEIEGFYAKPLADRNLKLSYDLPENIEIYADRGRLNMVLNNLIGNSIKYTQDGGYITLSAKQRGRDIEIAVEDNGIGIVNKDLENIFTPFFEGTTSEHHSTSSTAFMGGGTGLGLSICKRIITAHGGSIWAESDGFKSDGGSRTRLAFRIPMETGGGLADKISNTLPPELLKKEQYLLVVDDDIDILDLTEMMLSKSHKLMLARNGAEAISIIAKHQPFLVLLDIYLPDIDGFTICKLIKGNKDFSKIRLLLFSAFSSQGEIEEGIRCGADGFVKKPFTELELKDAIDRFQHP